MKMWPKVHDEQWLHQYGHSESADFHTSYAPILKKKMWNSIDEVRYVKLSLEDYTFFDT